MSLHQRQDFTIAALVHDLGHAPYSHALESVLLPEGFRSHEEVTSDILRHDRELFDALSNACDVEAVNLYIKAIHPNKALGNLISGEIDCDRIDYLVRDSEHAGVSYGLHDTEWLVHSLSIRWGRNIQPDLVIDRSRGFDSMQQFLSARRNMHRQVYYHHTTRAIEINLRSIFERIRDLTDDGIDFADLPACFEFLKREKSRPSLGEFIDLDDSKIDFLIFHLSKTSRDDILRYICEAFVKRETLSCIYDSARPHHKYPQYHSHGQMDWDNPPEQGTLFPFLSREGRIQQLQEAASMHFVAAGLPMELGRYLVAHDRLEFRSDVPRTLYCDTAGELQPVAEVDANSKGDHVFTDQKFLLDRVYVPRMFSDDLATVLYTSQI